MWDGIWFYYKLLLLFWKHAAIISYSPKNKNHYRIHIAEIAVDVMSEAVAEPVDHVQPQRRIHIHRKCTKNTQHQNTRQVYAHTSQPRSSFGEVCKMEQSE